MLATALDPDSELNCTLNSGFRMAASENLFAEEAGQQQLFPPLQQR